MRASARYNLLFTLLFLLSQGEECVAQVLERICVEHTRFDTLSPKRLRAEVDVFSFFHDNEYKSEITRGYTLPGLRLTPHISYNPHARINLEVGASLLVFNGANKYPCYAYHDIGTWKGDQYQHGVHALPWVRMQASFNHLDIILGNIYGGSNHRLSAPLFNAEQNMSADPETGFQLISHSKHITTDTWLNWQSYIFELDSHQEAFTVGENTKILYGGNDKKWRWSTPIQMTIQHRGGEQDTTMLGVQTLCNIALGAGIDGKHVSRLIDQLSFQTFAVASYQQAGNLWPFNSGFAVHAASQLTMYKKFSLAADYLYAPRQFISLFGNPFFSTISIRHPEITYHGTHVARLGAGYHYTFAHNYTIGANAELFYKYAERKNGEKPLSETNFSFGIYFSVSPSFLIKQF